MTTPPPSPTALRAAEKLKECFYIEESTGFCRSTANNEEIAAIIDRETAPTWLPIAEAPKDGTRVLIWSYGPGTEVGYFYVNGNFKQWRSAGTQRAPKYFQPLPAPPTEPNT